MTAHIEALELTTGDFVDVDVEYIQQDNYDPETGGDSSMVRILIIQDADGNSYKVSDFDYPTFIFEQIEQ